METSVRGYAVIPVCCNGCGACVAVCPELFALDEATEKSVALLAEAPVEAVERAMNVCPHDCIELD